MGPIPGTGRDGPDGPLMTLERVDDEMIVDAVTITPRIFGQDDLAGAVLGNPVGTTVPAIVWPNSGGNRSEEYDIVMGTVVYTICFPDNPPVPIGTDQVLTWVQASGTGEPATPVILTALAPVRYYGGANSGWYVDAQQRSN